VCASLTIVHHLHFISILQSTNLIYKIKNNEVLVHKNPENQPNFTFVNKEMNNASFLDIPKFRGAKK
jgi:hypothetical protein